MELNRMEGWKSKPKVKGEPFFYDVIPAFTVLITQWN